MKHVVSLCSSSSKLCVSLGQKPGASLFLHTDSVCAEGDTAGVLLTRSQEVGLLGMLAQI